METSSAKETSGAWTITIGVLSGLAGVLTTLSVIAFMIMVNIAISSITSLVFIGLAIAVNRIKNTIFLDACLISLYISGWCMLYYCRNEAKISDEMDFVRLLAFSALSILSIRLCKGFALPFLSVISFSLSLGLLIDHPIVIILIGIIYFVTNRMEATIASTSIGKCLFAPLQAGFFISFVIGLCLYKAIGWNHNDSLIWLISPFIWVGIIYTVAQIIKAMEVRSLKSQALIYALCGCFFIPTLYAPELAGAILLLLSSRYYNFKTETVISILLLLYSVSMYYYDLQYTLLIKSGILFATGLLMLTGWFFFNKQQKKS